MYRDLKTFLGCSPGGGGRGGSLHALTTAAQRNFETRHPMTGAGGEG